MSRELIDQIRAELAKAEARPGLHKASPDRRSKHRANAHAAFAAAVDSLLLVGWSKRRIADHLDVHVSTMIAWYEHGHSKRDQIPAWAFAALPREAQAAAMRVQLGWSEVPPPERTGTDG